MIKRITNKQGVNLASTYVIQGNSTPKGTEETYLAVGNNQEVLIKFTGFNLSQLDRVGRVLLRLVVAQDTTILPNPTEKSTFYVKRNTADFNPATVVWNTKPATASTSEAGFLVPFTQVAVGWTPEHPSQFPYKLIELDLTGIINYWKKNNISFHGITISKSSPGVIINPSQTASTGIEEYFIMEESKLQGLESLLSHTPVECGFPGKGYVNDLTGDFVFQTVELQTASKNAPIGFTAFRHNKNLTGFSKTSFLGSKFSASFEYAIKLDTYFALLVHPNGSESIFTKMTKEEALKYGISVTENEVYVDLSSYAYATSNGTSIVIRYPDFTKIEMNLHKIQKITVPSGDVINYYWNTTQSRLLYMMNSDGEKVDFYYNTNGKITEIDFVSEQRILQFTYDTNHAEITSIVLKKWVYDPESSSGDKLYTELEKATYNKSETHYTVVDVKNDDRTEFQMAAEKVYSVVSKKHASNQILNQVLFSRETAKTVIEDFLGNKQYVYFDDYGQVKHRIDAQGKSIKAEYELVGKDGTARRVSSKSEMQPNCNNLIVDFSFDNQIGEYKTTTKCWKKNTNTNNIVKSVDDGVFGHQCLMIRKTGSGQTRVTQLIKVNPGNYSFIGFEKRQGISGNPVIKANITYTILRLAQGSETGVIDESGNVWVNDTVTTSVQTPSLTGTTNKWQKFTLPTIIIPSGATNASIELEISASHTSGDLYVDDFQLVASEHAVNFNLIPHGYFEENVETIPTEWSSENLVSSDRIVDSSLDYPYHLFVGTKTMRFTGDFTKTKKLFKTFDVKGILGDELVFSGWFRGKVLANEEANVVVSFINGATSEVHTIPLQHNDSGWQHVSRGFVAKADFTQVKVSIEYRGFNVLLFDALQLYVNSNESHYAYDDLGNIMDQSSAKASSESISNALGQVVQSSNQQGETYRYKYDSKGRLKEVKDNKGNKVVHVYDSKGNPITMELESSLGKVVHQKTYNTKNQLLKYTDEFGHETINTYDNEFRHTEIMDALGHKDKYEYNEYDQLTKILRESSSEQCESLSYEYDEQRNLKKIIVDASKFYEFFYDTYNRIQKINLNTVTIVQYTYNQKHQVLTQKYGSSDGDYYTFVYDTKGRVVSVMFKNDTNNKCEYKYDELDRVSEVKYLGVTTYYSYDRTGKLIRKTDTEGQSERYIYDNIDAIQKSIVDINGLVRSYEYIMPYETSQYNFDGFLNRLDRAYDDDYLLVDSNYNGQTGIKAFGTSSNTIEDDVVLRTPVLVLGANAGEARFRISEANQRRSISKLTGHKFSYGTWKAKFDTKKTFFGWFKFSEGRSYDQTVFSVHSGNFLNQIDVTLQPNGQLKLRVKGQYHVIGSGAYLYQGTPWVMIGLILENSGNNIKASLYVNGAKRLDVTENIKLLPGDIENMKVKHFENLVLGVYNPDSFPLPTSPFKTAHMTVGAFDYSASELLKIYQLALSYFDGTIVRKQRSGVLYHDHKAYDGLDVVTLKGTLASHKGIHPTSIGYQAGSYKLDKTKLFEYDDQRKIHVYASYGNDKDLISSKAKLVYDFNMKNTGFIALRFKPKDTGSGLRTILSLQKGTDTPLGLYVNAANKLVLTLAQQEVLSNNVTHDAWNQLVIRWSGTSLWIYLNSDTVITKTKSASFENCLLAIGSLINSSEPTYHFNGQFEMLAHSNQAFDGTKATQVRNSYQTISYEAEYDMLGRKEKDELTIGSLKKTAEYTYKKPNGDPTKISFEVSLMKTLSNQNISYEYDALGNITKAITPEGTYEYTYDYMGRLIEEFNPTLGVAGQTIRIEYNKQNITSKKYYVGKTTTLVKQMDYTTNQEDQLTSVATTEGGTTTTMNATYDSKYIGNPITIGNKALIFEGRRLKTVTESSNTYTYSYNEQGIRTKKSVNGVETKYYIQGSNIIQEIKSGDSIRYVYDEKAELIGFEYQDNSYFYVRDLLGIIREIVDINGNVVVKYRYDAWGNHKVLNPNETENINSSFIGNINPFRYKGYYYDVETNWYYLQSRYYDPNLSRFINMDHTKFLEPGNMAGSNLFSYCTNNPIMFADQSGFMPKWAKWVVGGLAIAGLVAATVLTLGAAGPAAAVVGAAMLTGGLVSGGLNVIAQLSTTGKVDFTELAISTISGTAYGLVVATTGGTGAVLGKLAVAGGTSLLNSWNENKSFKDTAVSFGTSLLASGVLQTVGHFAPKVFGAIANSKVGQNVINKLSNPNHIMGIGDIAKVMWEIPAVQTGVIRFVAGLFDWISR